MIKKLFIKNFKGIKDSRIIEFSNTTLLTGPNGFGKTTIFDAIELCLTGKIERTITKKNITKHSKDYKKPFFQNQTDMDVILKLHLEKTTNGEKQSLIIVKHLPGKDSERNMVEGNKNKPDDFSIVNTYIGNEELFSQENHISIQSEKLTQEQIDNFLGLNKLKFNICDTFHIFNYLQQEETTFFLKKSETERKESLSYLFRTGDLEQKKESVSANKKLATELKGTLKPGIDKLKETIIDNPIKYSRVFNKIEIPFDKENPFLGDESYNFTNQEYIKDIDKIIEFCKSYSVDEAEKKVNMKFLDQINNNKDFIYGLALGNLANTESYNQAKKGRQIIEDTELIEFYVLKNYIDKLNELKLNIDKKAKFSNFESEKDLAEKLKMAKDLMIYLGTERSEIFSEKLAQYNTLKNSSDNLDSSLKEILKIRDQLSEVYVNYSSDNNETDCIFCGQEWYSKNNVISEFTTKTEKLRENINQQTELVIDVEKSMEIHDFQELLDYKADYVDKLILPEKSIIAKLEEFDKVTVKSELLTYLEKYDLGENKDFRTVGSVSDLSRIVGDIKKEIENSITIDLEVMALLDRLKNTSFNDQTIKLFKLIDEKNYADVLISEWDANTSIIEVNEVCRKILNIINESKEFYKYNDSMTLDPNDFYRKIFLGSEEDFNTVKNNVGLLEEKKSYLRQESKKRDNSLLREYEKRMKILDKFIELQDNLATLITHEINTYKKDMIKKIKIPFYIYSGKILQNYQQGTGISIETVGTSMRFITDSTTDHDAMHHLSSGQLAVVSLAFSLSVNKVYNLSNDVKFLLIDDPIQEMDVLNIHSFVQIIAHEFVDKYQLIFSTHNDSVGMYMKYKLSGFTDRNIDSINVQEKFFAPN